jgi:hypothetical protein
MPKDLGTIMTPTNGVHAEAHTNIIANLYQTSEVHLSLFLRKNVSGPIIFRPTEREVNKCMHTRVTCLLEASDALAGASFL